MIRRLTVAAAALALLAPLASAQTLDEVLAKHYTAMGGLDKIKAANSVRMTGVMAMGPGMEAPFVLEIKRPKSMRMEFTFQGMTGVQAYDGKQGWMVMPFMGKKDPEPVPPEQVKELEEQADMDGPLVDWKAKGNTVELLGKESVEGTDAYKLKVTRKSGDISTMYLDAENYLIIKSESKRTVRGAEVEGESIVGDYKPVEGIMFAFAMENGQKGSAQKQKLTFSKIEVNPTLDDSRYKMPAKPDSTGAKADSTAKASGAKAATKAPPAAAKKSGTTKTDK